MIHKLKNDRLTVQISDTGAELQSIQNIDGTEYLWQGNDSALRLRAPVLFPFVSWLYQSSYQLDGIRYQIPFLGFAFNSAMRLIEASDTMALYELTETKETLSCYPFRFSLLVRYQLDGGTLRTTFQVRNKDSRTMYFSLGWHPTFNVPLDSNLKFNDYCFDFTQEARPLRVLREENKYLGSWAPFPLEHGLHLPFDDAAFSKAGVTILRDVSKEVTLQSKKGKHGVRVSYPDMRLLVLFHKEGVPFITVEAWTSLMGRNNIIEDIASQPDLVPLSPGNEYCNEWTLGFF